ncbi:MAG: SDR family oxidoreductase [Congregibacter sp.]
MSNIVITGATAGIGRASAILLASKGHRVFATGRNEAALAELESGYENITAVEMDVTDKTSVSEAAARISDALAGQAPDVLVNNAGVAVAGPIEAIDDQSWERQYQTNVLGLVRVTRAFLPAMRERRRGRIINVSSAAGRVTLPFFAPYNSTKQAVESISDSMRQELRPHGVQVVVIEPGAVKTRLGSFEQEQLQDWVDDAPAYASQLKRLKTFHKQLYAKGADPVTVAGSIVDACETHNPSPRRIVPLLPGAVFILIKALLPTRVSDWVVQKITGLP